ncbi:hypothetical protein [Segniliparus rugosus]|uniref:hypothetical protein n=1 Tax=Segniliparus rugosus TaxID=286804 RepID=UPI001FCB87CD|nr:hypothetical protein [Segniliparus rugosus]
MALLFAVVLAMAGCDRIAQYLGPDDRPPPNVKGAPMEPMPTTRQQAQDAVYRYYQKTLRELPDGYALDNSRYGAVGATVSACNDYEPPNTAPAKYHDARTIIAPPGTDNLALVVKIGEIWKNWGWRVEERDGFNKPNRFGIAPDGYVLHVESDAQYPVMFEGSSPCFTGDKARYDYIPIPTLITRDGPQYAAPAKPPEVSESPRRVFNW